MSNIIQNGASTTVNLQTGEKLAASAIDGTFNAVIRAGVGVGTALATNALGGEYGPYASPVVIQISSSADGLVDFEVGTVPSLDYREAVTSVTNPLTGGISLWAGGVSLKLPEIISLLGFMSDSQKADAIAGSLILDMTIPVQKAFDHLKTIGGGVLGWYDVRVSDTLKIQGSNITIKPLGGKKLVQSGDKFNTILIYPTTLDSIWDGTGRPTGFSNGIDGSPELLMYDPSDSTRLHDINIAGLEFSYTGPGTNSGRFIDAFSVDRFSVVENKGASVGNCVTTWYCRDAILRGNDLTAGTGAFPSFFFKSYGDISNNSFRNGFNGFDGKGCYPQPGKTTLQEFDSGFEFYHPLKIHKNKVYNASNYGLTAGYRDNKSEDISATITTGVSKASWYGEVWGVEISDNTIYYSGTPGIDTNGINLNVNSKHFKICGNVMYGVGIGVFSAISNEIKNNTIINHRSTSTPAISIVGAVFGATSRNSQWNTIKGNRIINPQSNQPAIWIKGGDWNTVSDNEIIGGNSGTSSVKVDSSTSVSTSQYNTIRGNQIQKTAADFAYPITIGTATGSIVEQNRAFGGWYSGNGADSDAFSDAHYKRGVVFAATPTSYVGAAGTTSVGQNFGDQNITTPVTGYAGEMALNGMVAGSNWRQSVRFGSYSLWVDSAGKLRIKATKPTTDLDGVVVGTQT